MSGRRDEQLDQIACLASLIRDRELAKVARVAGHLGRLQGNANKLRDLIETRQRDRSFDDARLSGTDIAWQARIDGALRNTQSQIAAVRVTHEAALAAARVAFGRYEALSKLAERKSGKG